MTEKLKQTIEEEIVKLPKEGQEAISTVDWVKIAEEIGNENQLTEEEIEDFQLETLLVLIGATDPEFYAINIENQVELTKEKSESMANESFQKIFTPIRNILEENIKKNLKSKNPNWGQNLNFILSGGNYFAFIENRRENSPLEEYPSGGGGRIIPPRPSTTPQEGNKTSINPPTLKDIKDNLVL